MLQSNPLITGEVLRMGVLNEEEEIVETNSSGSDSDDDDAMETPKEGERSEDGVKEQRQTQLTPEERERRRKEKNKAKRKRQAAKKKLKLAQKEAAEDQLEVGANDVEKKKKKFYNPDSKKNKRTAEEIAKFKLRHKEKLRLAKKAAEGGQPVPTKKRRKTEMERKKEKARKASKAAASAVS